MWRINCYCLRLWFFWCGVIDCSTLDYFVYLVVCLITLFATAVVVVCMSLVVGFAVLFTLLLN